MVMVLQDSFDEEEHYSEDGFEQSWWDLLNNSNYKIWRSCVESLLIGKDCGRLSENNQVALAATKENTKTIEENAEALKNWKMVNGNAEFVLKSTISHELFEHTMSYWSAFDIWNTFDGLFNKKNVAWLQFLENELANTKQGDLFISQYFLKIKNLCSEIFILDPEEPISKSRMKRLIIRG